MQGNVHKSKFDYAQKHLRKLDGKHPAAKPNVERNHKEKHHSVIEQLENFRQIR